MTSATAAMSGVGILPGSQREPEPSCRPDRPKRPTSKARDEQD